MIPFDIIYHILSMYNPKEILSYTPPNGILNTQENFNVNDTLMLHQWALQLRLVSKSFYQAFENHISVLFYFQKKSIINEFAILNSSSTLEPNSFSTINRNLSFRTSGFGKYMISKQITKNNGLIFPFPNSWKTSCYLSKKLINSILHKTLPFFLCILDKNNYLSQVQSYESEDNRDYTQEDYLEYNSQDESDEEDENLETYIANFFVKSN